MLKCSRDRCVCAPQRLSAGTDDPKNAETKKDDAANNGNGEEEKPRRALPAPFDSPPFPTAEYQGFPLVGVPRSDTVYPLMKALYDDEAKDKRIKVYGWINASANWSTHRDSNTPRN